MMAPARRPALGTFVALCVVTALLSAFAAGPSTLPGDVRIAQWVQGWHGDGFQALADVGNGIASTKTAIAIWLALLLGSIALRRNLDTALLVVLGILRGLGALLKVVFISPRPTAPLIAIDGHFNGYGFPSGHTFTATCLGGAILLIAARRIHKRAERWAVYGIAVLIPLITGFARVWVGAHWPSDVLGGWLWGIIALVVAWVVSQRLVRRVSPMNRPAAS
jgi:undecaprenyl-diphosphatase